MKTSKRKRTKKGIWEKTDTMQGTEETKTNRKLKLHNSYSQETKDIVFVKWKQDVI